MTTKPLTTAAENITELLDLTAQGYLVYSDTFLLPRNYQAAAFSSTWSVATPAAVSFISGTKAFLIIQDLTYTSDVVGTVGNFIKIACVAGGVAGAEVVTVTGTGTALDPYIISVSMATGVSTAAQIKAAVDATPAAAFLVDVAISGVGGNAQAAFIATALAGGTSNSFNKSTEALPNRITIAAHGLTVGTKIALTTNDTFPTGLAALDYYIIYIDANTIKLASSLANALAGTAVNITGDGAGTHTVTASAGAGTINLQWSVDNAYWEDVPTGNGGESVNIATGTGNIWSVINTAVQYFRLKVNVTGGTFTGTAVATRK